MAQKIHCRQSVNGTAACAVKGVDRNNQIIRNSRSNYQCIPASHIVSVDDFRATPAADRCAHCCDRFTPMINARRRRSGKPLYKDAMTKELA